MCNGQTKTTNVTNYNQTNDLPDWAKQYYEDNIARAQAEFGKPYEAYTGQRIADTDPNTLAAREAVLGIAGTGISGLGTAQQYTQDSMDIARQLGNYNPTTFSAASFSDPNSFGNNERYTALGNYNPTNFSEFGYTSPQTFTGDAVQQYMSPYMQNVVDVQKNQALLDYNRLGGQRATQAVQAGAFGGSRQGVQEALAQEALTRQMADIQATGQQKAFDSAATQFGEDRAAKMKSEDARAAELGRVQTGTEAANQFGAGQGLAALNAQAGQFNTEQTAQRAVETARAAELGRVQTGTEGANQFGATQGIAALEAGQGLAGDLTKYGELERQTNIQNAQLLEGLGAAQTGEQQQRIDLDYQNWLEQQGYTTQQINNMTAVLSGQPVAATGSSTGQSTSVGTAPGPSKLQQVIGAGLSGLGLYKAYA